MTTTVKVEGLAELRKALLRTIPVEMQGKVLQNALAAGARPIVRDAKARAPVKTGRLAKAIYSARNRKASTRTREERVVTVRSGKRYGAKDAYYWKWVEFGRAEVVRKKGVLGKPSKGFFGPRVKAVPARPFMRPAFESQKRKAVDEIRDRLAVAIEKAARKASWRRSFSGGRASVR